MGAGAGVMLLLILLVLHYQGGRTQEIALKARKTHLVERMHFSLAAASEAEKSAVLATTDQDSQAFADQARAATAEVERGRLALGQLLGGGAGQKQKDLLARFSEFFVALQRVDSELLALAVKNTNVKAYALAFGPAAQAAEETDAALAHFLAKHATAGQRTLLTAAGAQAAVLRIESRLAPHIAEQSDRKMDEMEALMAGQDHEVRAAFDALAAQTALRSDSDLAAAKSSYARFNETRTQILALSRENTNVRSLAMSLDQKRKAMAMCQDALSALQREIVGESTPQAAVHSPR